MIFHAVFGVRFSVTFAQAQRLIPSRDNVMSDPWGVEGQVRSSRSAKLRSKPSVRWTLHGATRTRSSVEATCAAVDFQESV